VKPHMPPPRAPDAGPMPPPFTPPPPKKIYNIVEPSTLARVYAAAHTEGMRTSGGDIDTATANARFAVIDFIKLMREDYE